MSVSGSFELQPEELLLLVWSLDKLALLLRPQDPDKAEKMSAIAPRFVDAVEFSEVGANGTEERACQRQRPRSPE